MHRGPATYLKQEEDDGALIARHANLITYIARRVARYAGPAVSADDLWSVGALGLLDAWRRFDPTRPVRFESFAEYRIRGAMLDELRRMDHLPRRLRAETDRLKEAQTKLGGELGREPTAEELAAHLGIELEELGSLKALGEPLLPLPAELQMASQVPLADTQLARNELRVALTAAIGTLPPRLATVVSLYYVEDFTYREIAGVLEVTEARVCQLHGEAMGLLRETLAKS